MSFKKTIEKLREKKDLDWEQIDDIICQAYDTLERIDPRTYQHLTSQLETIAYSIDREDAETIVRNMRPKGQMWSFEQVKEFVKSRGISDRWVDWYLVMNMSYNDYYNTAKLYGHQNDEEFYFNLAKDFIDDPDADPHKVAKYFE